MSLWHLIDGSGVSVRTCEASCLAEARFRLAPIPKGCGVVSDASYRDPSPVPSGTVRSRLAKPKSHAQRVRAEINARYQRRRRGEDIPRRAKGTPNEKLRRLVLAENIHGTTDSALARRVGMSIEAVRHTRLLLRLPSANERLAMKVLVYRALGWSDTRIAERLGLWQASVSRIIRRTLSRRTA